MLVRLDSRKMQGQPKTKKKRDEKGCEEGENVEIGGQLMDLFSFFA